MQPAGRPSKDKLLVGGNDGQKRYVMVKVKISMAMAEHKSQTPEEVWRDPIRLRSAVN